MQDMLGNGAAKRLLREELVTEYVHSPNGSRYIHVGIRNIGASSGVHLAHRRPGHATLSKQLSVSGYIN